MVVALGLMAVGLFMLSHLRVDTPIPVLWAWMFVTGLGVGPTFAVFTLIVQNNVPVERLGTATSNLTFFQQVGGTVGLALTGTIFATSLTDELPRQLGSAGVPPAVGGALADSGGLDSLTGVGDLGAAILAAIPDAARDGVRPFVPAIVDAVHAALSIAISNTFVIGIGASIVAAVLVLFLREVPAPATEPELGSDGQRGASERTPSAI
jgi:hypothetical protein